MLAPFNLQLSTPSQAVSGSGSFNVGGTHSVVPPTTLYLVAALVALWILRR